MSPTTLVRSSQKSVVKSLGQLVSLWLDPHSAVRREGIEALQVSTGLPKRSIEQALTAAFSELTEEKILAFIASEPGFAQAKNCPRKVLHILAGNVFTSWLPGAVTTLLLGAQCDLKPSREEMVFAPMWKRSLAFVDTALAEQVSVVTHKPDVISRYPAVVAYGSDKTIESIRAALAPKAKFVGYGHKISFAVIWKDALAAANLPTLLEQVEQAAAPFDLAGCLSPQIIFVEGDDPGLFDHFYGHLRVLPRIMSFDSWETVTEQLEDFRPYLSTFGFAGSNDRTQNLSQEISAMGFSRVCRLEDMQKPPLTWHNGGLSLVTALTTR